MVENAENTLNSKPKVDKHNRIIWIVGVVILWYVVIFSSLEGILVASKSPIMKLIEDIGYEVNAMKFGMMYFSTIVPFVGIIIYTLVTKRNRFVLKTFLPKREGNTFGKLMAGFLVGFIMNFGCIVLALIHGDIKLYFNFAISQLPFFLLVFLFVFIQSSSEELWCRGFMYERIRVHYPLWVAIVVNGLFFALLHVFNPGVTVFPIVDIAVCGLSFSLAKWYSNSIWFPMGIHTTWNFTQNLIFGLPNSGIVSEASIWGLDAASAQDSFFYNVSFGVEGAMPALIADGLLGIVCLILAIKDGRIKELGQSLEKVGAVEVQYEPDIKAEASEYKEVYDEHAAAPAVITDGDAKATEAADPADGEAKATEAADPEREPAVEPEQDAAEDAKEPEQEPAAEQAAAENEAEALTKTEAESETASDTETENPFRAKMSEILDRETESGDSGEA